METRKENSKLDQETKEKYFKLVKLFNENLRVINRELNLTRTMELFNEYGTQDRGHLAKILSNRGLKFEGSALVPA